MLKFIIAPQLMSGVLRLKFLERAIFAGIKFYAENIYMFEQESYNQETAAQTPQEGELFGNYEIKTWDVSKRIYQILAVSAAINIFGLIFLSQTNVLTAKGCDSPFVGRVCQVLDTVYVGTMLFGTDREYADLAYEKTELEDADITFIDVGGNNAPLAYPEGYFQIANPVQFAMQQQMLANPTDPMAGFPMTTPGFTPNPTIADDILKTKPKKLVPNPNALQGDVPDMGFNTDDKPEPKVSIKKGPGKGRFSGNETAKVEPTPTPVPPADNLKIDPITKGVINDRPFKDLRVLVNNTVKAPDLQKPLVFNAKGRLNKDGKVDVKTFRYGTVSGDEKVIKIIKESIAAMGDSGRLLILSELGGKDINFNLVQDDTNVSSELRSEVENDERAKAIQSSLYLGTLVAKQFKQNAINNGTADQNDRDDLAILEGIKIEADGNNVIIKINLPKAMLHEMIQRKLMEKPKSPENSTAVVAPVSNTAK